MSAPADRYKIYETDWRANSPDSAPHLVASGASLKVELREWREGETAESAAPSIPEELAAVMRGEFELALGSERHIITAGRGALIPADEAHVWRALSDRAVLYRVFGPVSGD
jgi:quercetin dioxygenase-like cupin family protein